MLLSCGNGAKGIVSRNCRGYEDVCLGGCSSRRAKDQLLCNRKLWSFDSYRPADMSLSRKMDCNTDYMIEGTIMGMWETAPPVIRDV